MAEKGEAFGGPQTMSYSKTDIAALKTGKDGKENQHFEFWGSLLSNFNLAKIMVFILSGFVVFLLFDVYSLGHRPALVFKTTDKGESSSYVPANPDSVFDEELLYYTNEFIKSHTDLNPVSVKTSLERAISLTAGEARKTLTNEINKEDYIGTANKYRPTYNIEIGRIDIKSREYPFYKTYCVTNVNFIKPKNFVRVHVYEITWKKYNRTPQNPSGMYIVVLNHYDQADIKTNLKESN